MQSTIDDVKSRICQSRTNYHIWQTTEIIKMDTSTVKVAVESERSPQRQGRELEALLEGMEAQYPVLYGKFSATNSKTDKEKQHLARNSSSCSSSSRKSCCGSFYLLKLMFVYCINN